MGARVFTLCGGLALLAFLYFTAKTMECLQTAGTAALRSGPATKAPSAAPQVEVVEAVTAPAEVPKIPKILHQMWITRYGKSDVPLPEQPKLFQAEMRAVHEPLGWEVHLWGDELWDMYKGDKIVQTYKRANFPAKTVAFIADRFRILLLRDYGGVFCDVDAKLITSFDSLLNKLSPNTTFFAGVRSLENVMPSGILEVAVLGSEPHGIVVTSAVNMYTQPDKKGSLNLPHGGRVGRWMGNFLDMHSVLLNYKFFYADKPTAETVVLQNGFELGTWRDKPEEKFAPVLSPHERGVLVSLLAATMKAAKATKLEMFLNGNSLLGYARNGTLHPWDDSVDFMLDRASKDRFSEDMVAELRKSNAVAVPFWGGFKVFFPDGLSIHNYPWKFPNVDILLYTKAEGENKVIEDLFPKSIVTHTYSEVYPLHEVQFEGSVVNVPRDVNKFLDQKIKDWRTICRSPAWGKKLEMAKQPSVLACAKLWKHFNFDRTWVIPPV